MEHPQRRLGIPDFLLLIFVVLKLTGHIDWSWWWVLSPLFFGLTVIYLFRVLFKRKP